MGADPITIVSYRPEWPAAFAMRRDQLSACLGDLALAIEHVGSTSVRGMSGKDTVDIDVVVRSADDLRGAAERLAGIGYTHRGGLGIPGRDVFDAADGFPHNLYVCADGALAFRNHIAIREHLRANPREAQEYSDLKVSLATRYPLDRAAYVEGKTAFLTRILRGCGFTEAELSLIRDMNRSVRNLPRS